MQQMQSRDPSAGSLPHGGQLVDRRLAAEEAAAASGGVASLVVTPAEAADLRALATGAYSPLTGFM
jgi:ATP sulfurylase